MHNSAVVHGDIARLQHHIYGLGFIDHFNSLTAPDKIGIIPDVDVIQETLLM